MADTIARPRAGAAGIVAACFPLDAAGWSPLVFSIGTVLSAVLQRLLLEPAASSQHVVEVNVGEMFGLAAMVALVLADRRSRAELARSDLAALVLCSLAWLVPEARAVYAGMTVAGLWFALRPSLGRRLTGLGQVWLALSVYELWGTLAFKLAYGAVEPVEVTAIYRVGRLFYGGLRRSGMYLSIRDDWSIVVLEGCSSFHNLSLTGLIWLCVLRIGGRDADLGALRALLASAALVVAINFARILLLLPSPEAYRFWHDGAGSTALALLSVLAAAVPAVLYVERQPCRPSPQR